MGHPIHFVYVWPLYFAFGHYTMYITVDTFEGRLETYLKGW